jgi:hypothetical protein
LQPENNCQPVDLFQDKTFWNLFVIWWLEFGNSLKRSFPLPLRGIAQDDGAAWIESLRDYRHLEPGEVG